MPPDTYTLTRRDALRMAALGVAGSLPSRAADSTWTTKQPGDPFGGLQVGLTSFSTRELSLDDTIRLLTTLGVKNIAIQVFPPSPTQLASGARSSAAKASRRGRCGFLAAASWDSKTTKPTCAASSTTSMTPGRRSSPSRSPRRRSRCSIASSRTTTSVSPSTRTAPKTNSTTGAGTRPASCR